MTILYSFLLFMLGAILASFDQLVSTRLPIQETLGGRSHCPVCHHDLRLLDVLPILGFIFNRGRCHFCDAKIPRSHILLEIIGGLLFVVAYLVNGFRIELFASLIMITVLLIESICDQMTQTVLDRIWIIGLIPLVILRLIQGTVLIYLSSSVVLFVVMLGFALFGRWIFKQEALGGGDVKLYLFIGFCLPLWLGLLSIFFASFFGFMYGLIHNKHKRVLIALVPFIFLGVLMAYFFGDRIIDWYLNLMGVYI
jgi:prepilin signal peptidase PulO-like enzyme (type II secretory pathway)